MRVWMIGLLVGCSDKGDVTTDSGSGDTGPVSSLTAVPHDGMGSLLRVTWEQDFAASSWLEFSVDEGVWLTSPAVDRAVGSAEELAIGTPFGTEVSVRVAWAEGVSETITATTDALPGGAPVASLVEGDPDGWDADSPWVLVCMYDAGSASITGAWAFIVDRQGRTVWAQEASTARVNMHTQLGASGDSILIDQNSFWTVFDLGSSARVHRINIEGEVTQTWDTPGLHHPFTELPDGTLAWGAISGYFTDESLKTLSPDGTERTLWSCREFLDAEANGGGEEDYCGSNTLSYRATTETFLYSFFSLETIMEVDAQTGELVRYFGHTGEAAWQFDPPESAFWWQHGGHYTESGTLLVSTKGTDAAKETLLREYAFDDDNQTLVEVLSFGEGEGVYGETMGEADYTIGGNLLHNYGSASRLREITPEGVVVWDVDWDAEMMGRSTPIPDLYALR